MMKLDRLAPATALLCTLCWLSSCGAATTHRSDREQAAANLLDDWHLAAAEADAARYFGHFAQGAVFVGTDATERWDLPAFKAFAAPYFSRGKAWTYKASVRHINLSGDGDVAWFHEQLHNHKYGQVRGSGVLLWQGGGWHIAQYVLSFPIPNGVAGKVIELVRSPPPRKALSPPAKAPEAR